MFLTPTVVVLQDKLPLAVVGSNTIIEVNGKRVRGRQYPWGVAEGRRAKTWRSAAEGAHTVDLLNPTDPLVSECYYSVIVYLSDSYLMDVGACVSVQDLWVFSLN